MATSTSNFLSLIRRACDRAKVGVLEMQRSASYVMLVISICIEIMALFDTAHNNFMSCCEFFFCQTLFCKIASSVKLFFFSHEDMI